MIKKLLAVVAVAFLLGACEETPPAPTPPPAPRNFPVFFDFDKSTLTPRALDIVKEAATVAKAGQNARVTCTGHTDTAGPSNYNMALSLRRASTVKDALVREGVPATAISVVGKGETALLVNTKDGVREPQNRRVEIVVQ
jgi:outer membrane protein OmpA-like peptidoglycan-associated protein